MQNKSYIIKNISNRFELDQAFFSPLMVAYGGFMLCTNGSCEVLINAKQYIINRWDMIVAMPYSLMQLSKKSVDFESVIIGVNIDFFIKLQIPNRMEYYSLVKDHPSISISEEEAKDILTLKDKLVSEEEEDSGPFNRDINDSILRIIFYKGLNIYSSKKPNSAKHSTREETIFYTFITDIFTFYKKERGLNFYAQRQLLTPSYLSRAVKKASGRNASTWLIDIIINNIKYSLTNSEETISTISEDYNFPSNSIFSQYFKKYVGQSPKEFRGKLKG